MVLWTLVTLIGWYSWAYLTYFIGTTLLSEPQTRATHSELLRTLGFSSSPGVLRLLGIIPGLTVVVFGVVSVWMLVTMVVAVRQALDYTSVVRAIVVCTIGWLIVLLLLLLFVSSLAGGLLNGH
jgi:hypothetical protein